MGFELAKAELEVLAREMLEDATLLIEAGRWSNGFYLAGYSVEIALKACIAKTFKAATLPDKALVIATYTHKYDELINTAQLRAELREAQAASTDFTTNWGIVNTWSPDARYLTANEQMAKELLTAIRSDKFGVYAWIKGFW